MLAAAMGMGACSFAPEYGVLRPAASPDAGGSADGASSGHRPDASGDGASVAEDGYIDAPPDAGTSQDAAMTPDTATGPMTWTVIVGPNGTHSFSPATVSIRVGDTVHWVWQGSGHTVTSGSGGVPDGAFCSPSDTSCGSPVTSDVGATYDHVFTTAGTFAYFCTQHSQMTGSIVAQ